MESRAKLGALSLDVTIMDKKGVAFYSEKMEDKANIETKSAEHSKEVKIEKVIEEKPLQQNGISYEYLLKYIDHYTERST